MKIQYEVVSVDPLLLFQRMATASTNHDNMSDIFRYELCSYPPALFELPDMMRQANKASLGDGLWSPVLESSPKPPEQAQYVSDVGALLYIIPWTKRASSDNIHRSYQTYVTRKYGRAIVVFDGYLGAPSTKDCTHIRRSGGYISSTVHLDHTMTLQTKKETFLANTQNKQRVIKMLGNKLESVGCDVSHTKGDADVLVVETAVKSADQTS